MKWHKFNDLVEQYPWLLDFALSFLDIEHLNGYLPEDPRRTTEVRRLLKKCIREDVRYIAFHPFESLDLTSKTTSFSELRISISYIIHYHIEGEEVGSRLMMVGLSDENIAECVESLHVTHRAEAHDAGKALIVDRIVREDVFSNPSRNFISFSIQIYVCHPGCGLSRTPPLKPIHGNEVREAYMNHTPMPPIIPGMILDTQA